MESGYTIAVMPCGLDMVVPSENTGLFLQMIDNGSLAISEYPIGHALTKNKIILCRTRTGSLWLCGIKYIDS